MSPRPFRPQPAADEAATLLRQLAEDAKAAPHCRCRSRCDGPYGDGKKCYVCLARPTAELMRMVLR